MKRLVVATLIVAIVASCSSPGQTATASPAATPTHQFSPTPQAIHHIEESNEALPWYATPA